MDKKEMVLKKPGIIFTENEKLLLSTLHEIKNKLISNKSDEKIIQQIQKKLAQLSNQNGLEVCKNTDSLCLDIQKKIALSLRPNTTLISFEHQIDEEATIKLKNIMHFYQILQGLVQNSIQAIQGRGCISIHFFTSASHLIIDIKDNGMGIDEQTLIKLQQKQWTTTKPTGNGIGLRQAVDFVENHQGTWHLHSKQRLGTTFRLSLPLQRRPPLPPHSIFHLEDNSLIREGWKQFFHSHGVSYYGFSNLASLMGVNLQRIWNNRTLLCPNTSSYLTSCCILSFS